MIENVKSLELKGQMKLDKISQIFFAVSPEINSQIQSKLYKFKTIKDFFNYYTNKDINSFLKELNNININLSSICDDYYPLNASLIDKKIAIILKVSLLSKLIIDIRDILNTQLVSTNKYLFDLFNSNEFADEFNLHKKLKNLVESITNIENNLNLNQSTHLRKLSETNSTNSQFNNVSISNNSHNSFYYNLDINSLVKNSFLESNDKQISGEQTPSFNKAYMGIKNAKSLNIIRVCKKESEDTIKENSNDKIREKNSQLSLTDSIFVVDNPKTNIIENKKNNEKNLRNLLHSKKNKKIKRNKNYFNTNKKIPKCRSGDYKRLNIVKDKTKIYAYLLEIIKNSYNTCYINAEEKCKLKQLIISKPYLIEEIYKTFFVSGNNEKCKIVDYLKSYL